MVHDREVLTVLHVTDTGGENWGSQPLAQYSWSEADLGVDSVWCPTTSNHSGTVDF